MSSSKKHRPCPATGRTIPAAECGANRVLRYACPPDCVFNPFAPANYDQLSALEDHATEAAMGRLHEELRTSRAGEATLARLASLQDLGEADQECLWLFHGERDADGRTLLQRWERDGFAGQKNDTRVILRGRAQHRVLLLEVLCVRDSQTIEVVDLLAPGQPRLTVIDRGLASSANRFNVYLACGYPLPHYWRLLGFAIPLPSIVDFSPEQVFQELILHLGAPIEPADRQSWLVRHFRHIQSAVTATTQARQRAMWEQNDTFWGRAHYALEAPFEACREVLDASASIESEEPSHEERANGVTESRVWFDDAPSSEALASFGRPVLGRVLLQPSTWQLEAMGAERLARLRQAFEQCLGSRVRFVLESRQNLAPPQGFTPAPDPSLVPPRLLETPMRVHMGSFRVPPLPHGMSPEDHKAAIHLAHLRHFLDQTVPALNDRTPRQAATDPSLRPALIRLIKDHIRGQDERNRKLGRTDDINWLPRELGLHEIVFDPPPPRPGLEDDAEDETPRPLRPEIPADPSLPPAPALPLQAFSVEEADERLAIAGSTFNEFSEALDSLARSGSTVLEDASELCVKFLNEKDFVPSIPLLVNVWFAFVPPGHAAPRVSFDQWADAFRGEVAAMERLVRGQDPENFFRHLLSGPQPALSQMVCMAIMEEQSSLPKEVRPRIESQPLRMALVRSLITVLDRALRPSGTAPV